MRRRRRRRREWRWRGKGRGVDWGIDVMGSNRVYSSIKVTLHQPEKDPKNNTERNRIESHLASNLDEQDLAAMLPITNLALLSLTFELELLALLALAFRANVPLDDGIDVPPGLRGGRGDGPITQRTERGAPVQLPLARSGGTDVRVQQEMGIAVREETELTFER
jgi:hypothetical protein